MKNKILLPFLIFLSTITIGQTESNLKTRLGIQFDATTGAGLGITVEANNKHQFQATVLPFLSDDYSFLGFGLTYKNKFADNENWDILTYFGAASYGYFESDIDIDMDDIVLTGSGGLTFEYSTGDFLKLYINAGYGLYYGDSDYWSTAPSAGIGINFLLN